MADYDLKSITPKVSVAADTEFLFGAADQSSGTPIPYAFSIIKTWVKGWIAKADVGLGNVDNTSDVTKNAASVTLTNKTLTSPVINTPTGIVKGDVGLGNVLNSVQLVAANNLSDLGNASTARTNLGIGPVAGPYYPATGLANIYTGPVGVTTMSTGAVTALRLYMIPIYWRGGAATTIAWTMTVAGAAGKVARYGIYNMKADGTPGTLIQEVTAAGAQAVDVAAQTFTGTISQTLAAGWYFLAFVSDGGPTTIIANASAASPLGLNISGSTTCFVAYMLFRTLGALGAFGDESGNTFGTNASGTSFPILGIK